MELLKQPQYSPLPVERQVVSVWAGTSGYLDDVPVDDVKRFEDEFLDFLERSHDGIYASIRESGLLDDGTAAALKDAIEEFRRGFEISGGERLIVEEEPAEPMDEEDIDREKVTRYVPPPAPQG